MSDMRKFAGLAGIATVVVLVVSFLLPGEPLMIDDPDADILAFFVDNRGRILLAQWLTFVSVIPAILFSATSSSDYVLPSGRIPCLQWRR